jgi:hypothetical protein
MKPRRVMIDTDILSYQLAHHPKIRKKEESSQRPRQWFIATSSRLDSDRETSSVGATRIEGLRLELCL